MSHLRRIQVPDSLHARIGRAAEDLGITADEWIHHALEHVLEHGLSSASSPCSPLSRLASLDAPTADIDRMLDEIGAGRS